MNLFTKLATAIMLLPLFADAQLVIAPAGKEKLAVIKPGKPLVPVRKIASGGVIHRFHDTSPISPSGKYIALFRMPFGDRYPQPGDAGDVILVDLRTGKESVLERSFGWEMQVGANVQWGVTDHELYFNNVDTATWKTFTVKLDPLTGKRRQIDGSIFMVSADGKKLVSHNLINSIHAQSGYGVIVPEKLTHHNIGPVATDGIFVTDVETGKSKMIASIKDIYDRSVPSIVIPHPEEFEYYNFKAMWNAQGTRIMTVLQWTARKGGEKRRLTVITMKPDGTDIRTAIGELQYAKGGHHMAWLPDGEHISMNLEVDGKPGLELVTFKYDGSELTTVYPTGSGHPSYHPKGLPLIITDSYRDEPVAHNDSFVPVRLIDVKHGSEQLVANVFVPLPTDKAFRVDAHPTWDRTGRYVVFNGYGDGTRCVYIADMKSIVDGYTKPLAGKK